MPRAPKRGRYGGAVLDVFSRDAKRRACARLDHMKLRHGVRLYVKLLVNRGRGKRCRSWGSDAEMAECMTFSARRHYSEDYVTKCRRAAEDMGIIESEYVVPHHPGACNAYCKGVCGHFPSPKEPDVAGGGVRSNVGGRVKSVNMAFILGEGDRWPGPRREMGWQDDRERRESEKDEGHDGPPQAERPALVLVEGGGGDDDVAQVEGDFEAPAASPEASAAAGDARGGGGMDPEGGGVIHGHPCDLGSPPENHSGDRGPATSDGPGAACPPGIEAPADAGGRESETHDATLEAARAAPPAPSPSGPRRPEREQRTNEEQPPRQRLGVAGGAMDPESLARLRALCPDLDLSWAAPRVVPLFGSSGSSSSGPPPAPPARAPRLFDDDGPIGRFGERPPGWRPPRGGGGGRA